MSEPQVSEVYGMVMAESIAEITEQLDAVDADGKFKIDWDDEMTARVKARALRKTVGKIARTSMLVDEGMKQALIEAERTKSYLIDGSEESSLMGWAYTIEELAEILDRKDGRADYLTRLINSIVSMVVPIEMMQIKHPKENRNITAEDVMGAGARLVKEMPYFFGKGDEKEKVAIAKALVKGEGQRVILEKRGQLPDPSGNVVAVQHPVFYIKNNADGSKTLHATVQPNELTIIESQLRLFADFEYSGD